MKRLFLILAILVTCSTARAQQQQSLTASSTNCSAANSCLSVKVDPTQGGATFTLSGTFSATIQFEATGDGGTTWVSLNATPSNSSTAATSATAPGTWQANISGYTNVRIRVSTYVSGSVVASIIESTASARAGGGGGGGGFPVTTAVTVNTGGSISTTGTGTITATNAPVNGSTQCLHVNTSGVISGTGSDCGTASVTVSGLNTAQPAVLDTTGLTGADFGARLNTCNTQLGAGGGICNALNEVSSPTLTTAATISNPITVWMPCRQVNQTTTITFSGTGAGMKGCEDQSSTMLNNGTNTDMVSLSGTDNAVTYMRLDHNDSGNSFTGCNINVNSATRPVIEHTFLNTWVTGAICATAPGNLKITNVDYQDSAFATGPVFSASGGSGTIFNMNGQNLGSGNSFTFTGGTWRVTQSSIQSSGSAKIGISTVSPTTLNLSGNTLVQGGAGFPALAAFGAPVNVTSTAFAGGSNADAIQIGSNQCQFIGNFVTFTESSFTGVAGVHVKTDSIGCRIAQNIIKFNDTTPTGNNYGIWLDTSSGGHFLQHEILGNYIAGTANADDVGVFWDNTAASTGVGVTIAYTACVDIATLECVLRVDTGNHSANYMVNNTNNAANVYSIAGSTNDTIVDFSTTFANLPNAGPNSRGTITDSSTISSEGQTCAGSGSTVALVVYTGGLKKCF